MTFQLPENCGQLFVSDVEDILGISREDMYLLCNGRVVSRSDPLVAGCLYHLVPRVLGGKGGFGSMLRAIGAQIEKTTSREACRDLSGRRIRDVNNEKKLKEWVAKQGDRQREREEREERRRAKRAKYLEDTPAKMDNPEYDAQYSAIMKKTEEAIQEGLARLKKGGPSARKRKADSSSSCALDKYDRWNMMGGLNPDDLDSDSGSDSGEGCCSSSSSSEAYPGPCPGLTQDMPSSSSSSRDGHTSPRPSTAAPSATVTSSTVDSSSLDHCAQAASPCKKARLDSAPTTSSSEASSSTQAETKEAAAREKSPGSSEVSQEAAGLVKEDEKSACNGAASAPVESTGPIDLEEFSTAEDLEAVGLERLKEDLTRRGLKCGGSLQERAQRLFSIKGLAPEDIPPKLMAKGKGQGKSSRK